jgi:hypothetical protein
MKVKFRSWEKKGENAMQSGQKIGGGSREGRASVCIQQEMRVNDNVLCKGGNSR